MSLVQTRRPHIVYVVTSDTSADLLLRGRLSFLRGQGFEVSVICGKGERSQRVAEREGVQCHTLDLAREAAPHRDAAALWAMSRLLRMLSPDILNASTSKAALLGLCAGRLVSVPRRVYLLRGLRLETLGPAAQAGMRGVEMLCSGLAHHVLCVSPSLRDTYVKQGLAPAHKCRVLGSGSSNGVDVARFSRSPELERRAAAIAAQLGLDRDKPTLGFVGRPVADKGIMELTAVFQRVQRDFPGVQLLLVGAGLAGDTECAEMLALRKLPGVFAVPAVDDVAPYYLLMTLLVFPSYREGFPNAVLEASCASVPVVGFEATGVKDAVVHGVTGQLCRMRDHRALAALTLEYLRWPDLARSHGAAGAERARQEFQRERVWGEVAQFYRQILAQR